MTIVKCFRKYLRTLLVVGVFSYSNCFAPHEDLPEPGRPWYTSMCHDFRERLVLYKKTDPRSLETLVKRCEEECPTTAEPKSLHFCADIYCCQRFFSEECSYTGNEPDVFSEKSPYYDICMSNFGVEPLRGPQ